MTSETTAYSFPFDFSKQHTVYGAVRHTDGRTSIDCQCGRGCTGLTERDATTRWAAHMAEVQA